MASSRMITMMSIIVVTVLLFHLAGVIPAGSTAPGFLLTQTNLIDPQNLGDSSIYLVVAGLLTLGLAGLTVGTLVTRSFEAGLFYGVGVFIIGFFLNVFWDLIVIYEQLKLLDENFALLITLPLMLIYLLSIYDYARGRD